MDNKKQQNAGMQKRFNTAEVHRMEVTLRQMNVCVVHRIPRSQSNSDCSFNGIRLGFWLVLLWIWWLVRICMLRMRMDKMLEEERIKCQITIPESSVTVPLVFLNLNKTLENMAGSDRKKKKKQIHNEAEKHGSNHVEGSNSVYTGGLDKIDIVICPVVNV
ncbi:transmembrane protein, putative [Medicago truncatula]|uniref:Transmembrane protein, putative n=1 Tax=Medicago truncatula TaxID=3880 RepID=A0A072VRM1_MEDTR|nr:transmembrane protein, putative [Medicago truncatula]